MSVSVFGVDLGNLYSTVSVARRRGIDIIINEVSKRETSTYVSFGNADEGRMIGEKGADMKVRNFRNTATHFKRMLGVKYNSDEWQQEMKHCLFRTAEGADGFVEVEVDVDGEPTRYRPEQLIAMVLTKLRSYADREANEDQHIKTAAVKVIDCVLSCPPYFNALQRQLLLQATKIAGLNCLTLITEGAAVAISYGIFKSETLPDKEEDGVLTYFVDMGHSATYITAVKFWKGHLRVVSHFYDKHLGCRDYDYLLADHFRGEIQGKYKMDVYEQKKAKLRLLAGCEKLRYTLSANPVVSLNVECIMNDTDISFSQYKRDHFEALSAPLWEKMEKLVARSLEGVDINQVHAVEIVGGGAYMPKVKEILSAAFKKPISTTLNAAEAVAKGCGIIGAILSPRFHVKDFEINDAIIHDINVGYFSPISEGNSPVSFIKDINKETALFSKHSGFPKAFDLSFDRKETFDLYAYYKEPNPEVSNVSGSLLLGHWTFSNLPVAKNLQGEPEPEKPVRVAVRFRCNSCGIVSVDGAAVTEQYEVQEVVEKKAEKKEGEEEKEPEKQTVVKKKSRKIDVPFKSNFTLGHAPAVLQKMIEAEAAMSAKDQLLVDTVNARNALESFAYEYRDKMEQGGLLYNYIESHHRDEFKKACDDAVNWCYGDGEHATKDEYAAKLLELRRPGDAALKRYHAREELPHVFNTTEKLVLSQMDEANKLLGSETHIPKEKLLEITKKGEEALAFVKEQRKDFEKTPLYADTLVNSNQITAKGNELVTFAKPIFATPKPQPPKEEATDSKPASPASPGKGAEGEATQQAGMDIDQTV